MLKTTCIKKKYSYTISMKKTTFIFILCVIFVFGYIKFTEYYISKGFKKCEGEKAKKQNEEILKQQSLIYKLQTENKRLKDVLATKDNQKFFDIDIPLSLQLCLKERNCK